MTSDLRQRIDRIHRGLDTGVLSLSNPRGRLVPITRSALANRDDLERMTAWRNKYMKWFFTQFFATPAATEQWLSEVLDKSTRLLYWVEWDKRRLGQVGWKIECDGVAELDQFIRGEPGGPANLMFMAEEALLDFLFRTAGCMHVIAKVLAGNLPALELHRSMAFEARRNIPMKAVSSDRGRRFEPTNEAGDTYAIELVLQAEKYKRAGSRNG